MKKYKNGYYEIEYVAVYNDYVYNVYYWHKDLRKPVYIGQALSEKSAKQMITRCQKLFENKLL